MSGRSPVAMPAVPARTGLASLCAAMALVAFAGAAGAQPRNGNRREFDRLVRAAAEHYEAGDGRAALQELERAYAIRPMPRLLYNLGRAHELAGDAAVAVTYYQRFLDTNPAPAERAVAEEARSVAQRRVDEARAAAERQRAEEAERQRAEAERVAALERARRAEEVRRRTPHPRPRARRFTAPVVASFGLAGAGLVAGTVLGALALGARGGFDDTRDAAQRADYADRGAAFATGADVAFATALVAGTVGAVLYLIQPTMEMVTDEAMPGAAP